ncbi:MAG: hypothetical protein K2I91_00105, partial [Muribaculaceae bacterium]|nr:hypothetical protein [Muribaculaceae bacterium]
MTGFGRGVATNPRKKITAEIKSLNSKQLDFFMRSPSQFRQLEVEIRNIVLGMLERGKVELNVTVENTGAGSEVTLNLPVLKAYKKQIEQMASALEIDVPTDWYATLMRLPDVMTTAGDELDEEDVECYKQAVNSALEALSDFRRAEGCKLYDFFVSKIE